MPIVLNSSHAVIRIPLKYIVVVVVVVSVFSSFIRKHHIVHKITPFYITLNIIHLFKLYLKTHNCIYRPLIHENLRFFFVFNIKSNTTTHKTLSRRRTVALEIQLSHHVRAFICQNGRQ